MVPSHEFLIRHIICRKVSATEEAKLLLLSSGNKQLAKEIKDHLKVKYDAVCCVRALQKLKFGFVTVDSFPN